MSDIMQILVLGFALGGVYALMASGPDADLRRDAHRQPRQPILIIGGAYVSYWLFKLYGLDPLVSMPIAFIVLFFVGIVLYKLVFEREAASAKYSEMTVLLTFGVAMCVDGLLGTLFSNTQRVTTPDYATDALILERRLHAQGPALCRASPRWSSSARSSCSCTTRRFGYAIRATTQNRAAAQLMGVNVGFVCARSPSASASGSPAPPAR